MTAVGLIGLRGIAQTCWRLVRASPAKRRVDHLRALTPAGEAARAKLLRDRRRRSALDQARARPALVAEVAGQSRWARAWRRGLAQRVDCLLISVGARLSSAARDVSNSAAHRHPSFVACRCPSGGEVGRIAGMRSRRGFNLGAYRSCQAACSWRGSPAETCRSRPLTRRTVSTRHRGRSRNCAIRRTQRQPPQWPGWDWDSPHQVEARGPIPRARGQYPRDRGRGVPGRFPSPQGKASRTNPKTSALSALARPRAAHRNNATIVI